jgi:hypothetical protein
MVSSLIPGILTQGIAGVLAPRHSPAVRSARRAENLAKKADQFAETIHRYESENPPTGDPREAVFRYMTKIDDPPKFATEGDRLLGQFGGYVKGSLTMDLERRTVSFQHRGTDTLESQYQVYLSAKTSVPILPQSK